jgi:serine/threonine-protein kinase
VKVADFGLARVAGDGGANLTQVGVTMGTPLYMSPEQIEGREIDSRSDIYSLGITAYHMLTGQPPFSGDSPLAVAVQHLNQHPPALTLAGKSDGDTSNGSGEFGQIVQRMIAKKPADRFRDPAHLLEQLNALLKLGIEQGWAARPDHGSLAEILQAADQRAVATSRLDELMKTTAMARPSRLSPARIAAAVATSILVGAVIAFLARPNSLLAGAESGPERSDDVWGQLYQAKLVDTEDGWLAVERNFPSDAYHINLARQGLVYHYLTRTQDYEKVIRPAEQLAGAAQSSFQAFGRAGLIVAYVNLGESEQAYYANQRLTPEMRSLLDQQAPRMAQLLNQALDDLADQAI